MFVSESIVVGITAPSGSGKSFMTDVISEKWPGFQKPVVATTRAPRTDIIEPHRVCLGRDAFNEAVKKGEIVLPHRPFRGADTPEYGFVRDTLEQGGPILTEVHSSIIGDFRELLVERRVIIVGMVASRATLSMNLFNRDGQNNEFDFRMQSSVCEADQITQSLNSGLIDLVVDYEPENRKLSEKLVIDFINEALGE
jgi:guanylate kinase